LKLADRRENFDVPVAPSHCTFNAGSQRSWSNSAGGEDRLMRTTPLEAVRSRKEKEKERKKYIGLAGTSRKEISRIGY